MQSALTSQVATVGPRVCSSNSSQRRKFLSLMEPSLSILVGSLVGVLGMILVSISVNALAPDGVAICLCCCFPESRLFLAALTMANRAVCLP